MMLGSAQVRRGARRTLWALAAGAVVGSAAAAAPAAPKESYDAMATRLGAVSPAVTLVGGVAVATRTVVDRDGPRPLLHTLTTFRVDDVLHGGDLPGYITVSTPGGTYHGITEQLSGASSIRRGARSVLAVNRESSGSFALAFGRGVAVEQVAVQCPQDVPAPGPYPSPGSTPGWCNENDGILPTAGVGWYYDPTDEQVPGALTAIQAAFSTWMSVSSVHPGYTFQGTKTGEPHDTQAVNLVSWAANGYYGCSASGGSGCAGECIYWHSADNAQMLNFDIFLNVSNVSAASLPLTMLHEIGHSLGLAHINDLTQVMAPVGAMGTDGGLGPGDINGEVALYGGTQTGSAGAGGTGPPPADPPGTLQCGASTVAEVAEPASVDHTPQPYAAQTKTVRNTSGVSLGRVTVADGAVAGGHFWARVFSRRVSLPAGRYMVTTCMIVQSAGGATLYTHSVHRTRHSTHAFKVRPLILKHSFTRPGGGAPDVIYGWIVVSHNGTVVARSQPAMISAT
jgi:hypothetical protein